MKAVRVLLLLVLAFLALLPAGRSSPVAADWGSISDIALRGQTVTAPPAPTIKLADFGPPDVNDVLQVTFMAWKDVGGGAAGAPCVLYRSTAGTLEALAYDLQATSLPPEYGPLELCPHISERPPMVDGAGGVVFQGRVPTAGGPAKGIFFSNAPSTSVTAIVYEGQSTGLPIGGDFGPPSLMDYTSQCDNAVDDDGDNWVNDGCPPLVTAENPLTECDDSNDDDGDGRVNDGCPTVAPTAETALQVLFHATVTGGGSAPEGLFLATGPNASTVTFTKVVAPGDPVIGGSIGTLGDASMNNSGDVAYQADISGVAPLNEGIFLAGGGGGAHTKVVGADAPETGTQCTESPGSALDDDGDGYYNEGCPADEGKEEGSECNGNADDDGDDAWPLDMDNDQDADIFDVMKFVGIVANPPNDTCT